MAGGFTIEVELLHHLFEAASNEDLLEGEWPPHPARLFSGLVSVAEGPNHLAALDWLQEQGPPRIGASPPSEVTTSSRSNFVVTNEVVAKPSSYQEHAARRASGRRHWVRVVPHDPVVRFSWEGDPGHHVEHLRDLVHRLPYLGRSTTPVVARLEVGSASGAATGWWQPDPGGQVDLSVAVPGYRQGLDEAFEADQRAWTVARGWCRYRAPDDPVIADAGCLPEPFADREWVVFGIERPAKPAYQHLIAYTAAFRRAVLAVAGDDAPAVVHGHAPPGAPVPAHLMFLGLPFVGHPHADGHLLGFAVSIPTEISDADRAVCYRALLGIDELVHPKLGQLRLRRGELGGRAGLDPRRWSEPSKVWTSAYPVVLGRFARRSVEVERELRRTCEEAGLPVPREIEWARLPFITGPDRFRGADTLRQRDQVIRPFLHVRLQFDEPVAGPIVLGHMRHFGLGLLLPEAWR